MKKFIISLVIVAIIIFISYKYPVKIYNFFNAFFEKPTMQYSSTKIESIENLQNLVTAYYNMDYLLIAHKKENGKIKKYVAIYSFLVESGIDLKKVEISNTSSNLTVITLPKPEISYYGDSFKNKPLIIVDQITAPDYYKDPIIAGLQEYIKDVAIKDGIYDKASTNAKDFLKKILGDENFDIVVQKKDISFNNIDIDRMSSYFELNSEFTEKYTENENGKYFAIFKDNYSNRPVIYFNYSQQWYNDSNKLFDDFNKNFKGDISYKLLNPENPEDFSYVFKINGKNAMGFILNDGKLINFKFYPSSLGKFKDALPDLVYCILSYKNNDYTDVAKINKYKKFIDNLYELQNAIELGRSGEMIQIYNQIENFNVPIYTKYATFLKLFNDIVFNNLDVCDQFNDDSLRLLSNVYYDIKNHKNYVVNYEDSFINWIETNEDLEKSFEPTIQTNYHNKWFNSDYFQSLKNEFIKYLLENYGVSDKKNINELKKTIFGNGVFDYTLWSSKYLSDFDRKEYLKKIYINMIKNSNITNYFYYYNNWDLKIANLIDDPYFESANILYDGSLKNMSINKRINDSLIIEKITDYFKNKDNWKNINDVLKQNFNTVDYLGIEENAKKFIDNNFVIVLTKNALNIPKNIFKDYDIFIFGRKGILEFQLSKKYLLFEYYIKYLGFRPYKNFQTAHKNMAFLKILNLFNQESYNNLGQEISFKTLKIMKFLIRNKINIYRVNSF